ncbi:HesA/MoeB/ThiF family protein [Gallionella capsiferriformans]|jgi:adenylyltransferase/sulfurtransferase|uniref:Molybdopterin-synthase adenylyltransferase n=1 Tax=Gallionella capsiferriformans (strain ES-2) TaxID=395494 RepID=D9SIX7_GALCS|nr:HesA/MoeB/ThiF family protein [Gallionella capsiferriformans]ADL54253.1 UBA/THIF-type NAD/FAD binding protein [Gallionella capsiferriformans ES-2]
MDDFQLQRYGRHILLDEIGIEGQQRLIESRVLIVGLGGLGSPASLYLAASGVGQITLCDDDSVDLSNLQRQIAHRTSSIGQSKVGSAAAAILDINPETHCIQFESRVNQTDLNQLVALHDVVLDCSDNFSTRYAVNQACKTHHTPLISGAAILFSGQASVFDFRDPNAACYNCLFPEDSDAENLRCATTGIFSPLAGIIGTIQAAETLKLLIGIQPGLSGKLLTVNALDMSFRHSVITKDHHCSRCSSS